MATHVQNMGKNSLASSATPTFSPSSNQSALGNKLILCAEGTSSFVSVVDSQSNTWTIDKQAATGTTQVMIASCIPTTALTTSDTITITVSGTNQIWYALEEFSGLQGVAPDVTGSATTVSGAPATVSVTTTADDLLFAAWCYFSSASPLTFTPTSGWAGDAASTSANPFSPGSSGPTCSVKWCW